MFFVFCFHKVKHDGISAQGKKFHTSSDEPTSECGVVLGESELGPYGGGPVVVGVASASYQVADVFPPESHGV